VPVASEEAFAAEEDIVCSHTYICFDGDTSCDGDGLSSLSSLDDDDTVPKYLLAISHRFPTNDDGNEADVVWTTGNDKP